MGAGGGSWSRVWAARKQRDACGCLASFPCLLQQVQDTNPKYHRFRILVHVIIPKGTLILGCVPSLALTATILHSPFRGLAFSGHVSLAFSIQYVTFCMWLPYKQCFQTLAWLGIWQYFILWLTSVSLCGYIFNPFTGWWILGFLPFDWVFFSWLPPPEVASSWACCWRLAGNLFLQFLNCVASAKSLPFSEPQLLYSKHEDQ